MRRRSARRTRARRFAIATKLWQSGASSLTEITVAIYGSSQQEAEKIIADSVAERKRSLVADIVTFRAELTKTLLAQPKKPAPESTPTPAGQGL